MFRVQLAGSMLLVLLAVPYVVGQQPDAGGLTVDQWSRLLTQRDPRQRSQAAKALGSLGPRAQEAVPALAATLSDTNSEVRLQVATALGRIGAPAASTLPHLIAGLRDDDEYARYAAAWALERIAGDLHKDGETVPDTELPQLVAWLQAAENALAHAGAAKPARQLTQTRVLFQNRMTLLVAARPLQPVDAEPPLQLVDEVVEPEIEEDAVDVARPAEVAVERTPPAEVAVEVAAPAETTPAEQLLRNLSGQDSLGRVRTVHALAQLGDEGVPALIEAVRIEQALREEAADSDDDVDITPAIFETLRRLGPVAAPALAKSLGVEDLGYHVSFLLEEMGADARVATPALIESVKNRQNNEQLRDLAAGALGSIGPEARQAVPVLIGILSDIEEAESLRCSVALALGEIGEEARQAVPQLIIVLTDDSDEEFVRSNVAKILPQVGAPAEQAVPALLSLFETGDNENVWWSVVSAIAEYGDAAGSAVPFLVRLLDHEDVYLRGAAAQALADIGGTPPDAQEALLRLLVDVEAEDDAQASAAAALARIGPPAIAALIGRLDAADQHDVARAAAALARIGPDAATATGKLRAILLDAGQGRARRYAAIALGEFGPAAREAVDDLRDVVTSDAEPAPLRGIVATALGELGEIARPAVPGLVEVMQDVDAPASTRAMCALAVAKISPEGIPALVEALDGDHPVVRAAAARALESAAVVAKRAVPTLLDLMEDDESGFLASEVFQQMGDVAVWHLLQMVRDEQIDIETRRRAVRMLGDLYLHDELQDRVVEVLVEVLHDDQLREEIEWALSNCGTSAVPPLLAALEREERRGADSPACQTLRSLAVELCVPTGRGGGCGCMDDYTGFEKYDQLDIYNLPPPMAGERSFEPDMAAMAAELMGGTPREAALEGAEPQPEEVDAADGSVTPRGLAAFEEGSEDFETVKVYYGTNRQPVGSMVSSAPDVSWHFLPTAIAGIATMFFGVFGYLRSQAKVRAALAYCGMLLTVGLAYASVLISAKVDPAAAPPMLEYGSRHSDVVEMGVCEVSIPRTHEMGRFESPSLLKFEVQEDPQKHIVLRCVERRAPDEFFGELRDDLDRRGDSILVFVHGYNVTFENAARRTAQMAHDLKFQGAPMFYSWPSHGNWYRYREDEQHVELAVDHMRQFLVDVARRSQADSIHLIAHSMGNRALTAALREIEVRTGEQGALFNQVVLAAPDINAEVFKTRVAPAIVQRAERVTLYASSGDLALAASRLFNAGGARAGDSTDGPLVVPGIETIDVTDVDCSLLGHGYYGSNRMILDDLRQLLAHARPAADRMQLQLIARDDQKYWVCQPTETAAAGSVSPDMQR